MDYLQELARKVLKNRFTSANESYIDMNRYSRETMEKLIKELYIKTQTNGIYYKEHRSSRPTQKNAQVRKITTKKINQE